MLIHIPAGVTLLIDGPFEAPPERIFAFGSPDAKVVFSRGAVSEVLPEWWGATPGAQDSASAALNVAAVGQAFSSLSAGTVRLQAAVYYVDGPIGPTASYTGLVGAGANATIVSNISATTDTLRIDGSVDQSDRTVQAPSLIDHAFIRDLGTSRTREPITPAIGGETRGPKGLRHRYAANSRIDNVISDRDFIGYYESITTSSTVGIGCVRGAGSAKASDRYYGVYSDGAPAPARIQGISANGSSRKSGFVNAVGFPGTSYGYFLIGNDLRDQFWNNIETAQCSYGCTITGNYSSDFDIHLLNPILDGCEQGGLTISNLGDEGVVSVVDGWIAPAAGTTNSNQLPLVLITNSCGVSLSGGLQIFSGDNHGYQVGVRLVNSLRCSISNVTFRNNAHHLQLLASSNNTISGCSFYNLAGHTLTTAVSLLSSSRVTISGNVIDGADPAYRQQGIVADGASGYCYFNNTINPGAIKHPVTVNGAAVETAGTYNNCVVAGVLN